MSPEPCPEPWLDRGTPPHHGAHSPDRGRGSSRRANAGELTIPAVPDPFRFVFRVRYGECDAQKIVFNARWAEYVDLAATEYTRLLFGSVDPDVAGLDWRLVRQLVEWRAPARFDDILVAEVSTMRVGTTSFTLATRFRRHGEPDVLVTAETVYVAVEPHRGVKQAVPDRHRAALDAGAPGAVVDQVGAGTAPGGRA